MRIEAFCRFSRQALWGLLLSTLGTSAARSDDAPSEAKKDHAIAIGDKLLLTIPAPWERKEPKSRIIEYEFAIPAVEPDKDPSRLTGMSAGGTIEQNIARWMDQFTQSDGSSTKDKSKVKRITVAGQEVHLVDISGTYLDRPMPAARPTPRPEYRMLAAIISIQGGGNHYLKFYGPARTVAKNEKPFLQMIDGVRPK